MLVALCQHKITTELRGLRAGRLFLKISKSSNFRLLTFQVSYFSLAANRLINLIYCDSLIVPAMVAMSFKPITRPTTLASPGNASSPM